MKCLNCGADIFDGARFCPYCGSENFEMQVVQDVANNCVEEETTEEFKYSQNDYSMQYNANVQTEQPPYYYEEADMYRKPVVNNQKTNKTLWIVICVLVVAIISTLIILFSSGVLENGKDNKSASIKECMICEDEFKGKGKYCDDCMEEYACEYCDTVSEDVEDGICEDCKVEYTCRGCDEVDDRVEDGYCPDCAEDMQCKNDDCEELVEEGYYCDDCIDNLLSEGKFCIWCGDRLSNEEIFLIDNGGYVYCEDCDTGNYCHKCQGYLESDDDDDVCYYCAQYACEQCGEVLEKYEVYDNYYCKDCADY